MSDPIAVCKVSDLESGKAMKVEVNDTRVALVRIGDDFYAINDTCSHANVSLSQGEVYEREKEIECWKHGSTFSLLTGAAQILPATKPVAVYEVSVVGDDVFVSV